jgi:hypothetical protein
VSPLPDIYFDGCVQSLKLSQLKTSLFSTISSKFSHIRQSLLQVAGHHFVLAGVTHWIPAHSAGNHDKLFLYAV